MLNNLRSALTLSSTVLLAMLAAFVAPAEGFARSSRNYILKPTGPWQLDYSRDSCNLLHAYEDDAGQVVTLRIEQFAPGAKLSIALLGDLARSPDALVNLTTTFLPGGEPNEAKDALTGTTALKDKVLPSIFVGMATLAGGKHEPEVPDTEMRPEEAAAIRTVVIDAQSIHKRFELWTGSFDKVMAAMRQCTANLVEGWGLDPAMQEKLVPPAPKGNPGLWVVASDYPAKDLWALKSAFVNFRLMVDDKGEVADCAVQDIVPIPDFAQVTCALLKKRAHFKPAQDANGNPQASYYVNTVRWLTFG